MLFIGIDLGTSACKLLLVGEDGTIQNEVTKEYPLSLSLIHISEPTRP